MNGGCIAGTTSQRAAFFDVDGTLINGVGVGWMLQTMIANTADPDLVEAYHSIVQRLRNREDPASLTIDGFRLFTGQSWEEMMRLGAHWFREHGYRQLIPATLERLTQHQARGDVVVLVSGSWLPCIQPLAAHLGVDHILCSKVATDGDQVTGQTELALVGVAKARAVLAFAAEQQLDLDASYAYADDPSDEFILATVGHPVVIGDNEHLRHVAATQGWDMLEPRDFDPADASPGRAGP